MKTNKKLRAPRLIESVTIWPLIKIAALLIFTLLCFPVANAQAFVAPKIDGVVGPTEYGVRREGENAKISGGAQWFITWDDANLYLAITGSNPAHAAVIYLDTDDPSIVEAKSKGTAIGHRFDIAAVKSLPFKADFVAYFKNDHREYRRAAVPRRSNAATASAWGAPVTAFGTYAFALGTTRELALPWTAITGGARPRSFNFFGYVVMTDGFVYGQVPSENARGRISTTAVYEHYYAVKSTAPGEDAATKPFAVTVNTVEKQTAPQ